MRKSRITQAQKIAELFDRLDFVEQQLRVHIQSTERMLRFLYERNPQDTDQEE